jgi:hypothetical protein
MVRFLPQAGTTVLADLVYRLEGTILIALYLIISVAAFYVP